LEETTTTEGRIGRWDATEEAMEQPVGRQPIWIAAQETGKATSPPPDMRLLQVHVQKTSVHQKNQATCTIF
jgi:hypothetical protein